MTLWTIEPVVLTVIVKGNMLDVSAAKAKFSRCIDVIKPMTMSSSNTVFVARLHPSIVPAPTVLTQRVDNEIKGRWAGWLAWKEFEEMVATSFTKLKI